MSPAGAEGEGDRPCLKGPGARTAKGSPAKGTKGRRETRPAKDRARRKRSNPLARLRTGEAIYLASAILLFVLMFLDWWEYAAGREMNGEIGSISIFDPSQNAWQALEVIPLFLMLAIVVAVGAALLRLIGSDWKPAIPPGAAVCVLGLLASLLVLIRIISPPDLVPSALAGVAAQTSLQLPIFLGIAAALGIAYGGWRAMADEGTSFAGVAQRLESPARPKPAAKKKPTVKSTSDAKSAAKKPVPDEKPAGKGPGPPRRSPRKKPQA